MRPIGWNFDSALKPAPQAQQRVSKTIDAKASHACAYQRDCPRSQRGASVCWWRPEAPTCRKRESVLVLKSKRRLALRTALTRMPRGPSSTASAFVRVLRPPFDVAYLRRGAGEHQQCSRGDVLLYARGEARLGQVGVNGRHHYHRAACSLRWRWRASAKAHRSNGNVTDSCLKHRQQQLGEHVGRGEVGVDDRVEVFQRHLAERRHNLECCVVD